MFDVNIKAHRNMTLISFISRQWHDCSGSGAAEINTETVLTVI